MVARCSHNLQQSKAFASKLANQLVIVFIELIGDKINYHNARSKRLGDQRRVNYFGNQTNEHIT